MDAPYTAYTTWEDKCYRTPMDLNNVKILIGSVTETISRKIILGDEAYSKALSNPAPSPKTLGLSLVFLGSFSSFFKTLVTISSSIYSNNSSSSLSQCEP